MRIAMALLADETGATSIEYALLITLFGAGLLGAFGTLANQVEESYSDLATTYEDAQ